MEGNSDEKARDGWLIDGMELLFFTEICEPQSLIEWFLGWRRTRMPAAHARMGLGVQKGVLDY